MRFSCKIEKFIKFIQQYINYFGIREKEREFFILFNIFISKDK